MIQGFKMLLKDLFLGMSFSDGLAEFSAILSMLIVLLILSTIIDKISRKIIISSVNQFAKKSKTNWDDMLVKHSVFSAIAHIIPLLVILYFLPFIFKGYDTVVLYIDRLNELVILLAGLVVVFRFLNALREILSGIELFKDKPLQSYFQLIKIIFTILLIILVLSVLFDKSIMYFLGAFGAVSAVLLLIFKDTILGFIASIQMAVNDMIRVGDWVQMDRYGADGDVIEINLTTVKVKNWDKTITTVPTYSFISDSFKNWRGMQETGARRICRSFYIDQQSVVFCTEEMIEKYKKIHLLVDYVKDKEVEIASYNKEKNVDISHVSNGRRMTNLGILRAYLLRYLQNHPKINKDLTILVRLLEPNENGVPMQIYCFCDDIAWVNYEAVQSDIFDHLFAVINQFDLKIFQNPSGSDLQFLKKN